ncbi:beta-N-acetylhexosaminidase [Paenibacillus sp. LMG 31457]|uniref:Beta-N-acetylhexosaminidase n=2 Tax=Paenibacillus planticolens TaxID=2654976 RepID=A0ABX1ZV94_9BACL|nr:beta-N-acetylhexosaminidase [Paenibacillus planticolens]
MMNVKKSLFQDGIWRKTTTLFLAVTIAIPLFSVPVSQAAETEPASSFPVISPIPQSVSVKGQGFIIPAEVGLVTGSGTDSAAVQAVEGILRNAGVQSIKRANDSSAVPDAPVNVWVGGPSENTASGAVLQDLGVTGPEDLKEDGYVLASGIDSSGHKNIVLAGKNQTGTFYAAQTLRQIITAKESSYSIPGLTVRDWPKMNWRGSIEGFYGDPWSHEDRLSQLAFYGEQKMNMFIYAPKDDPYHRDKWRDPYPADKVAQIAELIDKAKQEHVEFVFAISPGNTVCFSDNTDFQALTAKAQVMWDKGVRSFALFLDDINKTLSCSADKTKFNSDASPPAAAQAFLLNRFKTEFIDTHPGAHRLITVPTDYANITTTTYINRFSALVDPSIIVQWTGAAVVPAGISVSDADKAKSIYKHDLLIWDNYPVNDYARDKIYLGPLYNRDAGLADHGIIGLTANPMNEAEASKIALFSIADYLWNPQAYDPDSSWLLSIKRLGGPAAEALKTFAENHYSSPLNAKESLTLSPLIDNLWTAFTGSGTITETVNQLISEFTKLQQTPAILRSTLGHANFIAETAYYLNKDELYGKAGVEAAQMLLSQKRNNKQQAAAHRTALNTLKTQISAIKQVKANQVFEDFFARAIRENDNWLGVVPATPFPITTMGTYQTNTPDKMLDGNLNTYFWSNSNPAVGDVLGVDLNEVRKVTNVQVFMGKSGSLSDYIHHGILEYSVDGSTWTKLATLEEQSEINVPVDNQKARFVRIRVTDTQNFWVIVREFKVTSEAIPKDPAVVLEGNDTVQAGEEFMLNLGLDNVRHSVYAQDISMEYDPNAMEFVSAAPVQDGIQLLATVKNTAGKLRLITASEGAAHGVTGSAQLLKLIFKAKHVPQAVEGLVTVSDITLGDDQGAETKLASSAMGIQITLPSIDKSDLTDLIHVAQTAHDAALEGTQIGQYPVGAKQLLQTAIDVAKIVANDANATQEQVSTAVATLHGALDTFKASIITRDMGDINNDGKVSIGDLAIAASFYGLTSSSPNWEQAKKADVNGDNVIDIFDLAAIARKIIE